MGSRSTSSERSDTSPSPLLERGEDGGVLRERDFRWLLFGQFAAQGADGLAQAAFADVLILEPLTQGTPEKILQLFALTLLPYSLIAPFLGVFVDRWSRRGLLVWTNVLRAVLLVTLPLWAPLLGGDLPLYVATLTLLGLGRLFLTTKGAVLPVLLHEHHLLQGNSLSSGGGMIAALGGGVCGIIAVGVFGYETAFVVAGFLYVASALMCRVISSSLSHPHPKVKKLSAHVMELTIDLGDGFREIWTRVHARLPLIGIFLLRTIAMFVAISAILFIKIEFEPAERFGRLSSAALALGAAGVGAFAGAVTAPFLGRRFLNAGLITAGFAISSVGIVLLGGIANTPAVMGLTFFGGYGAFVTKVAVDAQVQEALPDEYRGRAFALYDILYNLASVAAGVIMVVFFGIPGRADLVLAGAVALVITAVMAWAMRRAGMPLLVTAVVAPRA
ncbi:MAG: MFS transporter [Actinomycetota bacterium]|nr:MFS transporter [Actinomycetota bacterium]